ncbi:FkbM family methyltransferase [Tabrizicola fusiformis]|uniref:FkbM family methyltransferase n=1 Tax=Tabrizicola sp. SY72 TaxID=2741673 RepID=UPI001572EC5D|nr:FkbM family methyltransferase [Tabrizicola sp. SY72]NTT87499.1 FkbM family methyltransferase [Tabrizicola sp. SY72]
MAETEVSTLAAHLALLRAELPFARLTRVVDVGANPLLDAAPYAALLRLGGCDVVGFEPQDKAFAALMRDKGPNETYFPHAVGDGSAQILHLYTSQGFASVFPPNPEARILATGDWQEITAKVPFQTVRLDDLDTLGAVDLIKIDIQGGEAAVLAHALGALGEAVVVITEQRYFRLYEGEPMAAGVDAVLTAQGFAIHKLLSINSFQLNSSRRKFLAREATADQAVDGDVAYIRNPAGIAGWSDQQVLHLTLLASLVLESHSLVLYCLDEAVRRGLARRNLADAYLRLLPDHLLSPKFKAVK